MQGSVPTLRKVQPSSLLASQSHVSLNSTTEGGGGGTSTGGGKARKIKLQEESKTKNALVFLAVMTLIFIAAMVKLRHNHDVPKLRHFGQQKKLLRSNGLVKKEIPSSIAELSHVTKEVFIPPHSLYRLSVPDITGTTVALEKFYGMVTLVVNVACM